MTLLERIAREKNRCTRAEATRDCPEQHTWTEGRAPRPLRRAALAPNPEGALPMSISIVLPDSITAAEAETVVRTAIREAARVEALGLAADLGCDDCQAYHGFGHPDYFHAPVVAPMTELERRAQDGDR